MTTYMITRPEHDDTTHYLSHWSQETIEVANKKGIKVLDLYREKATKQQVESLLKKHNPAIIVLNGHGDEKTVTGHQNIPLIQAGENEHLLKEKQVYAISCSSGKILGPESINKGAVSYTGYDEDFIFFYNPEMISRPLKDDMAKLFLDHVKIFIDSLLKGNAVGEAYARAKERLRENLVKSLSTQEQDPILARYLRWNLRHFVVHGNTDAKIE